MPERVGERVLGEGKGGSDFLLYRPRESNMGGGADGSLLTKVASKT